MKIKYAITSCNDNPLYYEFWPVISKVWSEFLNIEPILIYIGDELPIGLENNKYGKIIRFSPISNIPTSSQSQFIRLWYPQLFPDDVCITTDIDMIPLSKWYFKDQISSISEDKFIALNLEGLSYSICYNIAKGKVFKSTLDLKDSFGDTLIPFYNNVLKKDGRVWFTDEKYLADKINPNDIIVIKRKNVRQNRIDRNFWSYDPASVKIGLYYDCHSLRPYSKYKNGIDKLINCIL
jgi:hypothetical protein